ncbi:hypothetical protein FSP39_010568 [Pinctada imbricata]|uniref:Uncharacterized protein n=1 Tax=Pinctada imbricata TaxID=66713 RepID=A0AA89BSW5_PINIB|nr:hypothetical protein FSP39_010568 [Pinctada imbricata]
MDYNFKSLFILSILRKKTIYGNKVFIDEIRDLEAKDAFRIDRKSNAENWNYQSLYKGHVAKFHDTYRTCMGQTDGEPLYVREKIEKEVKKEKKRYYSKENARVANRAPIERLCTDDTSAKNGQTVLPEKMLLPSEPITKERIRDVDVREKLLDADTKLYVEGKGSVKDDIDEGEISADVLASHRKIEEYNRKLREDPHNVPCG